jgi:hypothetical protein
MQQTPETTRSEAYYPRVSTRSGQRTPTSTNLTPGSATTTMQPPIPEKSSTRGHIEGSLMSTGTVRVRLAWARRLETKRHRTNTTMKQTMPVDHWPTLRPPSLPISKQIGPHFPPLHGSLHSFGWRLDPNFKTRHDPPVRAEYPFDYSPPHSPIGEPATASTDHPPPLGCFHTSTPRESSQETSHSEDGLAVLTHPPHPMRRIHRSGRCP